MSKQCTDYYGETLKIGDKVIPIVHEALIIGIEGYISNIEYDEKYNQPLITITDEEGKFLVNNMNSRHYTTKERYIEREKQPYVYDLSFFDKNLWRMKGVPLTNRTDPNYEIPDEAALVVLKANHLVTKGRRLSSISSQKASYLHSNIYYFIVDNTFELCYEKEDDFLYLLSEAKFSCPINKNYKIFKNNKDLKQYVKKIINYFNNADLTHVNNEKEFQKNENGKVFEKKLIKRLRS